MLKVIRVSDEASKEAINWLKQNLSAEGVRWWANSVPKIFYPDSKTHVGGGIEVTVDVTDEEEALVTTFVLRFVQ